MIKSILEQTVRSTSLVGYYRRLQWAFAVLFSIELISLTLQLRHLSQLFVFFYLITFQLFGKMVSMMRFDMLFVTCSS